VTSRLGTGKTITFFTVQLYLLHREKRTAKKEASMEVAVIVGEGGLEKNKTKPKISGSLYMFSFYRSFYG
jgi:hypothetical protein